VNPRTITPNAIIPASAVIHVVRPLMVPLVSDAECTEEAIGRRANYVGPVLEHIRTDIETHWANNLDVEEPEP
jgi:hypothetical protein